MGDKLKIYIDKLNEKNVNLREFLDYVSIKDFKISEEELQHIENYIKKRDILLKNLNVIEKEIKNLNLMDDYKNNDVAISIIEDNNRIISKILEIDKKNNEKFMKILDILKGNVKSIKNTTKVNTKYYGAYTDYMMGSNFDSSS